jgi:cytochrome P450
VPPDALAAPAPSRPVPGRGSPSLLGALLHARRDRLGFVRRLAAHGDVVGFRLGARRFFLVSHPDPARRVLRDDAGRYRKGIGLQEARTFLGEGLLTAEGAAWEAQRRAVQPLFHAAAVQRCAPEVAAAADRLVARWRAAAAAGTPVDGMAEARRATLEVLLATLFRAPVTGEEGRLSEAFSVAGAYAVARITAPFAWTARLPTPANRRFRAAVALLHGYADGLLRRDRAEPDPESLIGHLRPAWEAAGATEAERRDQVVTLLLAGDETSAAACAWCWHLLSGDDEAQARVRDEARGAGPAADPARLPFTGQVVKEAMRLYPPVWLLPRVAVEADVVGGEAVPAGANVIVCPYTLHRNPRLWSRADAFDPDRFAAGRAYPHQAWIPFGVGERACVGTRLAMLEVPAIVAAAAAAFRIRPASTRPVRAQSGLTLHPRGGLPLRLSRA